MIDRRYLENVDWPLLVILFVLLSVGVVNLHSITVGKDHLANILSAQLLYILAGWLLFAAATLIDYKRYARLAYPCYWLVNGLLVFVLFFGREILGAKRWIHLGPLNMQPSELAKVTIIFALARFFMKREGQGSFSLKQLLKPLLLMGVPMVLILKEPDLGTSLIVAAIAFCLILIKGIKTRSLVVMFLALALLVPSAWFFVLKDYQKERVKTFLNPERDVRGSGYHIIQSKIAIGSGKFWGKGYLKNTQGKLEFLPKQHTDFVFSNFAEEWGYVGCVVLLGIYFLLIANAMKIAYRAKDDLGALISTGVAAYFFCHVFINIGMEIGLLPVVGVTLPLFSYGGSSLLITMFLAGMLMNVSMRRFLF